MASKSGKPKHDHSLNQNAKKFLNGRTQAEQLIIWADIHKLSLNDKEKFNEMFDFFYKNNQKLGTKKYVKTRFSLICRRALTTNEYRHLEPLVKNRKNAANSEFEKKNEKVKEEIEKNERIIVLTKENKEFKRINLEYRNVIFQK